MKIIAAPILISLFLNYAYASEQIPGKKSVVIESMGDKISSYDKLNPNDDTLRTINSNQVYGFESKSESEYETKPETQPEPEPESESESEAEYELDPDSDSEPEIETETEIETDSESDCEIEHESDSE